MTEESAYWLAALKGLARGFTYPDPDWVAHLLDGSWTDAWKDVCANLNALTFGEEIEQAVRALPEEPSAALQTLQVEYTYLFINAVPRVPAPPYASHYLGDGWLMGEAAGLAMQTYRNAGLNLSRDYHDLPDHIAAELQFVVWAGGQCQAAMEQEDRAKAQEWAGMLQMFRVNQLLPWLPKFCDRVQETARLPFYPIFARAAQYLLVTHSPFVTSTSPEPVREELSND